MHEKRFVRTQKLVLLAILTAIVVVLQLVASTIHLGIFSITLTLTPIVIGAALCSPLAGAYLGLVFGVTVLISGDAALFMAVNLPATVAIVLLKGALAGLAAGAVYRAIEKRSAKIAAFAAGVVSPVVNTGVFFAGCLLFFRDFCIQTAQNSGFSGNPVYMIFAAFVGGNFFVELIVNMALSGVIVIVVNRARQILHLTA